MPGARVDRPDFDTVVVLPHAVKQARARHADFTGNDEAVKAEIRRRVIEACHNGQVYDAPTRPFRVPGYRARGMPFWQRFVVFADCGFVVDVARLPQLQVVTMYVRFRD